MKATTFQAHLRRQVDLARGGILWFYLLRGYGNIIIWSGIWAGKVAWPEIIFAYLSVSFCSLVYLSHNFTHWPAKNTCANIYYLSLKTKRCSVASWTHANVVSNRERLQRLTSCGKITIWTWVQNVLRFVPLGIYLQTWADEWSALGTCQSFGWLAFTILTIAVLRISFSRSQVCK